MLTLQRKQEESIVIGEDELTVKSFNRDTADVSYQGKLHTLPRGKMYILAPNTILCYTEKRGNRIRIQTHSDQRISRKP